MPESDLEALTDPASSCPTTRPIRGSRRARRWRSLCAPPGKLLPRSMEKAMDVSSSNGKKPKANREIVPPVAESAFTCFSILGRGRNAYGIITLNMRSTSS